MCNSLIMLPERAEDLAKDYHDQDFTRSTEAGGDKQAVVTKEGTVTEEKKEDAAEAPLQADEVSKSWRSVGVVILWF